MIRSFRDLIAWQKARQLAVLSYRATREMPDDERFGLTSQLRRSAVSVPANIAEGYGRGSTADYLRFLRTARGSLAELYTHVDIANELNFLKSSDELVQLIDECDRVLQGLIRSVEASE